MLITSNPLVVPEQRFDTWYQTALAVSSPVGATVSVEINHQLIRYEGEVPVASELRHIHKIRDLYGFAAQRAANGNPDLANAIATLISVINAVVGEIDPAGPTETFSEVT